MSPVASFHCLALTSFEQFLSMLQLENLMIFNCAISLTFSVLQINQSMVTLKVQVNFERESAFNNCLQL